MYGLPLALHVWFVRMGSDTVVWACARPVSSSAPMAARAGGRNAAQMTFKTNQHLEFRPETGIPMRNRCV
jgi:hypothetical protein